MVLTRCGAAAAVCVAVAAVAGAADRKSAASKPDEPAVKALLAYCEKNNVPLKHVAGSEWVANDPKADGYAVVVHLLTFQADATEREMLDELKTINLAFMPNARAKLAMSYVGLRGVDEKKPLPKLDDIAVKSKLEKLFRDYEPEKK
jgi:hypothetical protein